MATDKLYHIYYNSIISGQVNRTEYVDSPLPIVFYSFFCNGGFTGTISYGIRDMITSGTYTLESIADTKDYARFCSGNQYVGKFCQSFVKITGATTGSYSLNITYKG